MTLTKTLLVFIEGLLAFISPCILPMLPVYLLYLSGTGSEVMAAKSESDKGGRRRLFLNALFFVIGFTLVFILLGMTSTSIGQLLSGHRVILEKVSGAIILLFGIHLTGIIQIPWLNQEHRIPVLAKGSREIRSLFLGIAFSLGWTPCLGPFLGSALLLSGQANTLWEGVLLLLVFSLGIAIPFLLTSLLFEELTGLFTWFKKHLRAIRILSGVLLIVMGFLMLLGWFGYYANLFS